VIDPTRGAKIALLVPFRDDHAVGRAANWAWLRKFWETELPGAEIVVGTDGGNPFSKTCSVNAAFRSSREDNDIIVILDADCYIEPSVILSCADAIRESIYRWKTPLWFIPYRWLFRLTEEATANLIASNPTNALRFPTPPLSDDVGSTFGSGIGHRFGALIQILPREAFVTIGGMPAPFRGWGGEDVSTLRILDTLYAIHETTRNEVLTLWHTALGDVYLRKWAGQDTTGVNNDLSLRYRKRRRDPLRMKREVAKWLNNPDYAQHRISPLPPWYSEISGWEDDGT